MTIGDAQLNILRVQKIQKTTRTLSRLNGRPRHNAVTFPTLVLVGNVP